jgi:murein DD-endopeptidase MepM/ murein hydrolase activator NlpD
VDIMYRDAGKWVAPEGTPILAAHDATVWSTGTTARGSNVVLDHGPPWASYYQHLSAIDPSIKKGARVQAGQHLGYMGADPTDPQGLRHLHFEAWFRGGAEAAVPIPASVIGAWKRILWTPE